MRPSRAAGAWVTLRDRGPVLYLARGRRSLITWGEDPTALGDAAASLSRALTSESVTLQRIDGVEVSALPAEDARIAALGEAGFARTPSGLRLRH